MTCKEIESCIQTIELLRRLAFNVHGVMDVIDAQNCDKIIELLKELKARRESEGKPFKPTFGEKDRKEY